MRLDLQHNACVLLDYETDDHYHSRICTKLIKAVSEAVLHIRASVVTHLKKARDRDAAKSTLLKHL